MSQGAGFHSLGLLHPTFEQWGGAEWFIHWTLQSLVHDLGVEAVVYTHRWTDPPGESPAYKVICHRMGGVWSSPWDWRRIARTLAVRWRDHDVLFVHNHPAALWYSSALGSAPLPNAVWFCHEPPGDLYAPEHVAGAGDRSGDGARDWLRSLGFYGTGAAWRLYSRSRREWSLRRMGEDAWLEDMRRRDRLAVDSLFLIVANSRYTAGRISSIYARDARVIHPLPPDLERLAPASEPHKGNVVLWVGRMVSAKRPLLLLEAWRKALTLDSRMEGYRIVFAGDGPLRGRLLERAGELGLARSVVCQARPSRSQVIALYRRSLVTVHLGLAEPFGLVPIESMAAGTPALVECQGGVRETVVDGRTGWCVEGLDAQRLAELLVAILTDRDEIAARGRAALEHVRDRFRYRESFDALVGSLALAASGPRAAARA